VEGFGAVAEIEAGGREALDLAAEQGRVGSIGSGAAGGVDIGEDADLGDAGGEGGGHRGGGAEDVEDDDRSARGVVRAEIGGEEDDLD
jgi:hypothetical protein